MATRPMSIVTDPSAHQLDASDVETASERLIPESSESLEAAAAPETVDLDDTKSRAKRKIEAFEIELGQQLPVDDDNLSLEEIMDRPNVASILRNPPDEQSFAPPPIAAALSEDEPNDMQSLLNSGDAKQQNTTTASNETSAPDDTSIKKSMLQQCLPCRDDSKYDRMGNIRILCPRTHSSSGWGVLGPHWFGPPCIMAILASASHYFIYTCGWQHQRYGVVTICTLFTLSTLYNLIQAAYRDPGVIVKGRYVVPDPVPRTFRWCETCEYYQPPRAAHCPDCNVCVAGFDHHCVWMSMCIGKGNFKPFMRFNLSWLAYLVYAIVWVSILAPILDKK